jgi:hypothetical protein
MTLQILPRGKVFVKRDDEMCHIACRWHGQRDKDLYITLCGKVVSTRTDSTRTTNVGYEVYHRGSCECIKCAIHLDQKMLLTHMVEEEME